MLFHLYQQKTWFLLWVLTVSSSHQQKYMRIKADRNQMPSGDFGHAPIAFRLACVRCTEPA